MRTQDGKDNDLCTFLNTEFYKIYTLTYTPSCNNNQLLLLELCTRIMTQIENEFKWSSTLPYFFSQCIDLSSVFSDIIALPYHYNIITNSRYIGKYSIKIPSYFVNFSRS